MEPQYKELTRGLGGQYRVGEFVWTVEGNTVLLTRDTKQGIESLQLYTYTDNERAHDAAWHMACQQCKA